MLEVALEMLIEAIGYRDQIVLDNLKARGRGAKYRETSFRKSLDKRGRT